MVELIGFIKNFSLKLWQLRWGLRCKEILNEKGIGMISIIIVSIVLVAVLTAVINLMQKDSQTNSNSYSSMTYATTIISQGANIKSGFDLMLNVKGVTPEEIVFNNTPNYGLFTGNTGGNINYPVPPIGSLDKNQLDEEMEQFGKWLYRKVKMKNVGVEDNPDYVTFLLGIDREVCKQINMLIFNEDENFLKSNINLLDFIGECNVSSGFTDMVNVLSPCEMNEIISKNENSPFQYMYAKISDILTVNNAYAFEMAGGNPFCEDTSNKIIMKEGCVKTNDNKYVYFYVLKAQ